MKNILVFSLFLTVIFSGCSTQPLKLLAVPLPNRLEVLKNSLSFEEKTMVFQNESEEIANDYLMAIKAKKEGKNELACQLFTDLSTNKNFAIKELAIIYTLSVCSFSKRELNRLWTKSTIPPYLKEFYTEQSLNLAVQKKMIEFEAQFSFDLIPFQANQSKKVKLIKRAIEIAESLDDVEKNKIFTERLKEISPLYNSEINNKNIFLIAKDFEANRQFEKARSLYYKIIEEDLPLENKVKAFNALRLSFKVERNLKMFLIKTFEMEVFLKSEIDKDPNGLNIQKTTEYWVDAKIALTRAVWTDHQNQKAREILDELIESDLGTPNQKGNIQFIYGSLHQENKKSIDALKCFEKAGDFNITDTVLAEKIQWAIIWNNYLTNKNKKVVNYVDLFIIKSKNQLFVTKLNFWKAKALTRLNKKDEAQQLFSLISASDSFGYYGIISLIELNNPFTPIPQNTLSRERTGKIVLDWLIAMEEEILAQKQLKEINSQFKTPAEREMAMSLYLQTKWYQGGMRQIYNFKESSRNPMTEKYINTVFPLPYLTSIEKLSTKYNVPIELILGIARQESTFVTSERSWADAFGLMQIIPEKATELSNKYGIPYHDFNDLYNPDINLEMGAVTLKELREAFNFNFVQSVAAYNASQNSISIWEKERFNGNYLEFIENIPYEETQNYVKLVFRNFIIYKRILSKTEFTIDPKFFERPF